MKSFLKNNIVLMHLQYLFFIGLWSYSTLAPLILTKHFHFSEISISFYQNFYILGFAFGFAFSSVSLSAKKSYIHSLSNSIIILPLLVLFNYISLHFSFNINFILASRVFEGIFSGVFISVLSFIIKLELLKYNKNGEINSYISSSIYVLKLILPIIAINYIIIRGYEENIFLISFFMYSFMAFTLLKNKKNLFFKYQIKISKYNKNHPPLNFFKSIKKNLHFFYKKDRLFYKLFFILTITLRYGLRPFFDLYIGIFLIKEYNISIIDITILISIMVFGQSTQILTGRLSDKISLFYYNLIQIIGILFIFISLYYFDFIYKNMNILYVLFFFIGFFRAMSANYDYKIVNLMIEEGKFQINQINFINHVFGELIHYIYYLSFAFLLIFISVKQLMIIPIVIILLSLLSLFVFDYKIFLLKKIKI